MKKYPLQILEKISAERFPFKHTSDARGIFEIRIRLKINGPDLILIISNA